MPPIPHLFSRYQHAYKLSMQFLFRCWKVFWRTYLKPVEWQWNFAMKLQPSLNLYASLALCISSNSTQQNIYQVHFKVGGLLFTEIQSSSQLLPINLHVRIRLWEYAFKNHCRKKNMQERHGSPQINLEMY